MGQSALGQAIQSPSLRLPVTVAYTRAMTSLHERLMSAGLNPSAIRAVAERHGATRIRVFGSFARGSSHSDSDLDLLVELKPGHSLLDVVAIKQDLQDLLGRRVDVVTERSISPYMRDAVCEEAVAI